MSQNYYFRLLKRHNREIYANISSNDFTVCFLLEAWKTPEFAINKHYEHHWISTSIHRLKTNVLYGSDAV